MSMTTHRLCLAIALTLGLQAETALAANTPSPSTQATKSSEKRSASKTRNTKTATPAARVEELPLSDAQLAVAPHVAHGEAHCEFNQKVLITPNPNKAGHFKLQFGKQTYNMTPEPTSTGAVRLEDKHAGVVWLQIPAKSMLMNTKVGQRLVDSCVNEEQKSFAAAMAAEAASAPGTGLGITQPQ
ncbi:hypothetical protein ACG0Z6_13655 [Roseateles sp. BYS180W]|uniref:Uncharacterized protein n=1 Tax=Roseateles rivi TaxID=3299028 RepID=A0ABW7FY66_9BURK